jgi:hypothetical protein
VKAAGLSGEIADNAALEALNTALTDVSRPVRTSARRANSEMREGRLSSNNLGERNTEQTETRWFT